RDVAALELLEADGERTGLQDERKVLGLLERAALPEVDLGVRAGDAVRVLLEVDRRRRADLAVEDDREVLEVVLRVALPAGEVEARLSALRLLPRDLVELVGAVIRELERDDRAAGLPEVGARAREDEVATRHLRDGVLLVRRVELREVVVRPARCRRGRTETARRGCAPEHGGVLGDLQN